MKFKKQIICALISCLAALLVLSGCGGNEVSSVDSRLLVSGGSSEETSSVSAEKITITVDVIKNGSTESHTVVTSADNLADALTGAGIAEGSVSDYGLMIETVDGYTADFSKNGEWWCINDGNGVMLTSGATQTEIKDGDSFQLVLTK